MSCVHRDSEVVAVELVPGRCEALLGGTSIQLVTLGLDDGGLSDDKPIRIDLRPSEARWLAVRLLGCAIQAEAEADGHGGEHERRA